VLTAIGDIASFSERFSSSNSSSDKMGEPVTKTIITTTMVYIKNITGHTQMIIRHDKGDYLSSLTLEVCGHGIEEECLIPIKVGHIRALPDKVLLQLVEIFIGKNLPITQHKCDRDDTH